MELWINDALMAIFFLLIGLELERELYSGELSDFRQALLPIFAAVGGMAVPALTHYFFNGGTPTQSGIGIPMATDIAFSLGVLALLGTRVPASLKVFVVAFAVIDDLGAIVLIATVYTAKVSIAYLAGAVAMWLCLIALNRIWRGAVQRGHRLAAVARVQHAAAHAGAVRRRAARVRDSVFSARRR
ncbi:MAG: Na+/H+ antiporter NhaA [Usitatibacteraceae bacterium]